MGWARHGHLMLLGVYDRYVRHETLEPHVRPRDGRHGTPVFLSQIREESGMPLPDIGTPKSDRPPRRPTRLKDERMHKAARQTKASMHTHQ